AASLGHAAVVKTLLDKGANPDTANKNGDTALIWAASNGYAAVVKMLQNHIDATTAFRPNHQPALPSIERNLGLD
ncbi:MAG: ankyrin repeat domain-containing protein, partial [Proteobacteria bacterium]|nr:ankyrin repeat domain-containing protein [Pseudomonadota bacterium]